jgi:hypothetical protein
MIGGFILLDFTVPSVSDESKFQYTFAPINISSFIGNIMLKLTLDTTSEMSDVRGTETFGIQLTNGTRYSEEVIEFQMVQIEYSTTEGPDNRFIPLNFFTVLISIVMVPIINQYNNLGK